MDRQRKEVRLDAALNGSENEDSDDKNETISDDEASDELLPFSVPTVVGCLGFSLAWIMRRVAVAFLIVAALVALALCNVYLMMKPLSMRMNAHWANLSTGCALSGSCVPGAICVDTPGFDWACFGIGLAVDLGEIIVAGVCYMFAESMWRRYGTTLRRPRTVKYE